MRRLFITLNEGVRCYHMVLEDTCSDSIELLVCWTSITHTYQVHWEAGLLPQSGACWCTPCLPEYRFPFSSCPKPCHKQDRPWTCDVLKEDDTINGDLPHCGTGRCRVKDLFVAIGQLKLTEIPPKTRLRCPQKAMPFFLSIFFRFLSNFSISEILKNEFSPMINNWTSSPLPPEVICSAFLVEVGGDVDSCAAK